MSRKYSYDMEVNKISNMTLEEICVGRFNYSGGCPAAILKFKKEIMLIGFDNINNSYGLLQVQKIFGS